MELLLLGGLGIVLGIVDVLPMIKQKLDRFSTISAFIFHVIMPFIVFSNSWNMDVWIKGGLLYVLMAIPIMVLAAKDDPKAVPMMAVASLILGMLSGFLISLM